jgi:serine/threonine protein kinase/tetratricopeptide (TPR) repeat protein
VVRQFPTPPPIPDYELVSLIGQGSYGDVWLARNAVGSLIAVKIVHRANFDHERPYQREFEGIRCFEPISRSDSSQVAILHVGRGDDFFYYIMELADRIDPLESSRVGRSEGVGPKRPDAPPAGEHLVDYSPKTLKGVLRARGFLPASECLEVGLALIRALAHLHGHGLVHRDVKPSNVIFVRGSAKLADVGLVTSVDATRSCVGTDGYLPPEGAGSPQADLYSLGKVLYEMVTGCDRKEFPALPSDLATRPDHDALAELNAIILRACAPDPLQRYQSATKMGAELQLLRAGRSVRQRRIWHRALALARRTSLVASIGALGVMAWLKGFSHATDHYSESPDPRVSFLMDEGFVHIRKGSEEEVRMALTNFQNVLALDSKFVPALDGLFDAVYKLPSEQRLTRLHEICRRIQDPAPNSSEAFQTAATIKLEEMDFLEAAELSRKATELPAHSKHGRAYSHLICSYLLQVTGDANGAERESRNALRIYRDDPVIQDHLGQPYFMRRQFRQALGFFLKSEEFQPNHENVHNWLRRTYEELEEFDHAVDEFRKVDRLYNQESASKADFYNALLRAAHDEGAKGYWRQRLHAALQQSDVLDTAVIYAHLGDKRNSYTYLDKARKYRNQITGLMVFPCFDHNDPEFRAIARKAKLMK